MATQLLIDTDVLIDYLRDYPDAVSYVEAQQERLLISYVTGPADFGVSVSLNSFLDTCRPKIMRAQPGHIVVHVSLGQGLCIHAGQSVTSHCIDAVTRAAPGEFRPPYQKS